MNWPQIKEKLDLYERLMRLDKPIGILLLLWPTLMGLVAFVKRPAGLDRALGLSSSGTVLMRSAGCVINDYADRDFDCHVERTKERPLTAGKVSTKEALALFAGLSLCAFVLVLMLGNKLGDLDVGAGYFSGGELSIHQAFPRYSPGLSGHCLRLRHSHGLRRAPRSRAGLRPGGCCWPMYSGRWPTIPNTPWSTAKMT
jgi:hypothetical protein